MVRMWGIMDVSATCWWWQDDGSVKCWGYNDVGNLGLGDDWDRGIFTYGHPPSPLFSGLWELRDIACGW